MKLRIAEDNYNVIDENKKYRRLSQALFGDPTGKIRTFAIVSPQNPLGWKDTDEEDFKKKYLQWLDNPKQYNKDSLDKIKSTDLLHKIEKEGDKTLKYGGFTYVPLKGKYGDYEKSFIIFNCSFDDARTIARNYGQESFFFGKVGKDVSEIAYYVTYNACKSYKLVDISKTVTYEDEATDFFSKYGFKFRINMREFGDDIPAIENDGEFEESFNDRERNFMSRATHRRNAYRK